MRTNCGTHYDAGPGNNDKTSEQISGVKEGRHWSPRQYVTFRTLWPRDPLSLPSRRLGNTNMNRELN